MLAITSVYVAILLLCDSARMGAVLGVHEQNLTVFLINVSIRFQMHVSISSFSLIITTLSSIYI